MLWDTEWHKGTTMWTDSLLDRGAQPNQRKADSCNANAQHNAWKATENMK